MGSVLDLIGERVASLERNLETLETEQLGLREEIARLREENDGLRAENARERAKVSTLEQQLAEFRRRLRTLLEEGEAAHTVEAANPPEPVAIRAQDPVPTVAEELAASPAEEATDTIHELVAHPFTRFASLGAFQDAVRELTGVRDVRLRHYDHGTLQLKIDYADAVPLAERLLDLPHFLGAVVEDGPRRLELRLADQDARQ
jgi:regulator of replication initiation timing